MWRVVARASVAACVLSTALVWAEAPATTTAPATASQPATAKKPQTLAEKYAKRFADFDAQDKAAFPQPGGTLFIGSSTFTLWKALPEVFKEFQPINRAFGGSVTPDMLAVMDKYVLPYKPAAVVFYCGSNDLGSRKPEDVAATVKKFCERLHEKLPETKFYFVSIKRTIKRAPQYEAVQKTNKLIQDFVATDTRRLRFIDIDTPSIIETGEPNREHLAKDLLHPSEKGYEVMAPIIKAALKADGFGNK